MRSYLVTGASGGLGLEIARQLSEAGKQVFNLDIKPPASDNGALYIPTDLRNASNMRRSVEFAMGHPDGIDCLVNNAGLNYNAWLEDTGLADWSDVFAVNVTAPFLLTQQLIPQLAERCGTVCNVTSNAAWTPMRASAAYNSSKAAAHMLTLQMARELTKDKGITVFGIAPGKMRGTGMSKYIEQKVLEVRGWTPEFAKQYQANGLVTGEEIEPEVLAEFIVWLLSEKKRHFYLSGVVIPYGG